MASAPQSVWPLGASRPEPSDDPFTGPWEAGILGTERDVAGLYQATLDSLPAHVAVLDERGTIVAVNAAWRNFAAANGGGAGTGVGADYFEVCRRSADHDPLCGTGAEVLIGLKDVLAGRRDQYVVAYACDSPEERRRFVLRATRFAGVDSRRIVLQHQDVTAHHLADEAARLRFKLLDAVDAAVIALDSKGAVSAWNHGAELLYGWRSDEALGRPATFIVPDPSDPLVEAAMASLRAQGRWEGELELERKDGSRFPAYVRNAVLEDADGRVAGHVGVSIDISERLEAERDLKSARDYLRAITDSMGDGLCTLDERGRIVLLNARAEALLGWTTAELAGQDLHDALHHTLPDGTASLAGDCPLVHARLGRHSALIEDDVLVRRDGTLLPVRHELTPLESAGGAGGFVLVFSDISARKRQEQGAAVKLRNLHWIERIRQAFEQDRFVLHAQPIVEIATGRTVQHELLIRMLDEDGSAIAPGLFLPVAEAYGLIGEIDHWVVRQAVDLAAEGHAVELNVSAHSLSDPMFYPYVDAELRRSGADPALLVFELTETALMRDEEAALRWVAAVAARGCGLALDDFGTGYGGFSYLKRLPVDYPKIDIEFVRDLASESASRQVVQAVVSLAKGFGIQTVAEGVEDDETLALLRQYGVDYAQGYGIGRPGAIKDTIRREPRGA